MAVQVQRRGGTTTQHETFTGANRELTVDTDKKTVVVHDGVTPGGHPLAREDLSNVDPTGLPLAKDDMSNVSGDAIASRGIAKQDMSNVALNAVAGLGLAKQDFSNVSIHATEAIRGLIKLANETLALEGSDHQTAMTPAMVRAAILNATVGIPRGHIDGFTLTVDANPRVLNVADGVCKSGDHASAISNPNPNALNLNVSGDNGLLSGTVQPDTWYEVLVGSKAGSPIGGFSTLNQKPADWDTFRRIGSIRTNANADIRPFDQFGNFFLWRSEVLEMQRYTTASAVALTVLVPPSIKALGLFKLITSANERALFVWGTNQNPPTRHDAKTGFASGNWTSFANQMKHLIVENAEINYSLIYESTGGNGTSTSSEIWTMGYHDPLI